MATLLHLDSSPLASSVSRELTREFVSNWKTAHPSGQVIDRDLAANPPKPVDQAWIYAAYTPAEARQPEQKALLAYSEECIAELEQADEYVIGVAMHNFSIPSVLKLWIDQVVRGGRTFAYGARRDLRACFRAKRPPFWWRPAESTTQEVPMRGIQLHRSLSSHHPRIYRHYGRDICDRRRDGAAHVGKRRSRPVPPTPPGAG